MYNNASRKQGFGDAQRGKHCNWIFFYRRWYRIFFLTHPSLTKATLAVLYRMCLVILLQNSAAEQQSIGKKKGSEDLKVKLCNQVSFCIPKGERQNRSILLNLKVNDFVCRFGDGTNQLRSRADSRGNYRSKSIADTWLIPVEYSFV